MHEQPLKCDFLFNFPFVCNICPKKEKCVKEIFIYDAYEADNASLFARYNCNKGPNLTLSELKTLDSKVSPRVLCGQSLYHIKTSDESITVSEQTIRRYINNGYLTAKILIYQELFKEKLRSIILKERQEYLSNY